MSNYLLKQFYYHSKKLKPCYKPDCMCFVNLTDMFNQENVNNKKIQSTYDQFQKCKKRSNSYYNIKYIKQDPDNFDRLF